MRKQAILFDIDGTLVDSNDGHVEAWQQAFRQNGYHLYWADIHRQIGKGGDNLVPSLVPDAPEVIRRSIEHLHGGIYKRDYLPRVRPFPGARELLQEAKQAGMAVVLATSASRSELDHYVGLLGAEDLIDGTTSKDDVGHSKPCPDIFDAALAEAGTDSSAALVIGDTPYDIRAAKRSGIDAIAVLSGGFSRDDLEAEGPIAIYDDVADLLGQFERNLIGA